MSISDKINIILACIAGLAAFISLAYTYLTLQILKTTRESVDALKKQVVAVSRPYIQITPYIRTGTTLLMLRISNSGSSPAEKLRLSLDRDFYIHGQEDTKFNLAAFSAFTKEIASFPPHASMEFHLGKGSSLFKQEGEQVKEVLFTVTAEYVFSGVRVLESTPVDLTPYAQSAMPIDPLHEKFDELRASLESLASTIRGRG